MRTFSSLVGDIVVSGGLATLGTTVAAAVCGHFRNRDAIQPINSVSHIIYGDEAAAETEVSLKYTATGFALNAAAVTSWAALHECLVGDQPPTARRAATSAAVTAASAYVTDYYIVPKWLTPGFEKPLDHRGVAIIFGTLAVCLATGSLLRSSSR